MMISDYKHGFEPIAHEFIKMGDEVWIDNYQDGIFPYANPKISGPFWKCQGNGSGRCFRNANDRSFIHYPEDMLRRTNDAFVLLSPQPRTIDSIPTHSL